VSRFNSDGDCDSNSNYVYLWDSRVRRIIEGKRGQRVLLELIEALLALPQRRLISGAIATPTGDVCTVGALAKKRGVNLDRDNLYARRDEPPRGWEGDEEETADLGASLGITWTLAWQLGYMNDEQFPSRRVYQRTKPVLVEVWNRYSDQTGRVAIERHYVPTGQIEVSGYTPEERWQCVYDWACSKIKDFYPPAVSA